MGDLPCFEELKALAEADPKAFEQFRQTICAEFICTVPTPHRRRLQGIQFRVNHEIRRARTPLAGVIRISCMMHDSLCELTEQMSELRIYSLAPLEQRSDPPRPPLAEVVQLEQWRRAPRRRH